MKKKMLDSEENAILESYDKGDFKSVKVKNAEMARLRKYARNTLQKNKTKDARIT